MRDSKGPAIVLACPFDYGDGLKRHRVAIADNEWISSTSILSSSMPYVLNECVQLFGLRLAHLLKPNRLECLHD